MISVDQLGKMGFVARLHLLGGGQLLVLGWRFQVGQLGAGGQANAGAHGFEQEALLGVLSRR